MRPLGQSPDWRKIPVWRLVLILLAFPHLVSSQEGLANELSYGVHRIYPPISISKEELKEAVTLMDLDKKYKSSWIREYISVEILASCNGRIQKALSKSDVLSREQKDIIHTADVGMDISVKVLYLPENTLKQNAPKEISFSVAIEPENEATYPGGQQALQQYLKEKTINNIPAGHFEEYQLAAVTFTVNEEGQITDPKVSWSSNDEKIDELLLETICNMPNWKPAAYANGVKVKQEFALMVGSMESCAVNLLNIRRD